MLYVYIAPQLIFGSRIVSILNISDLITYHINMVILCKTKGARANPDGGPGGLNHPL